MIGSVTLGRPAPEFYDGLFIVCFDALGYDDYKNVIKPWADENLVHGIKFQASASVLLYDESDYTLFMLRWA